MKSARVNDLQIGQVIDIDDRIALRVTRILHHDDMRFEPVVLIDMKDHKGETWQVEKPYHYLVRLYATDRPDLAWALHELCETLEEECSTPESIAAARRALEAL